MIGTSPPLRRTNVGRLDEGVFDVLVVGGGINGAVSSAALAAGGARVAVIDRGDFAHFTSQESSNLVWGGIKYLENLEFGLVWKLCSARNELIRCYPANVREIRFHVPLEKGWHGLARTAPALLAGAWLYWAMGRGFTRPPRLLTRGRVSREEASVKAELVRGGVEYSDAYLLDNDARFVFGFVRSALNHGACVANYVEAERSKRDADGVWETEARDLVTGRTFTIRSRVLLNAAGPYVDDVNLRNGVRTSARHLFSKGIHLVVPRVAQRDHVLTFFDRTNRMFFVIPMGDRSVVGTTDTRVERPESRVTEEDRRFVLENVNRRLVRSLEPEDVIAERCGVRPLVVEGGGHDDGSEWTSLSRKHVIEVDTEKRSISIFGGKLTDCLNIGEQIVGAVRTLEVAVPRHSERWYGEPPATMHREFLAEAASVRLDERPDAPRYEKLSTRLWRRYGSNAFGMLEEIGRDPRMGAPVIEGTQLRRCELEFAARREMVVRLEDFLRRRTKIELVLGKRALSQAAGLEEACEILAGPEATAWSAEYFALAEARRETARPGVRG